MSNKGHDYESWLKPAEMRGTAVLICAGLWTEQTGLLFCGLSNSKKKM